MQKDQPAKEKNASRAPVGAALNRVALNIVGTNVIQNVGVTIDSEGKAVAAADAGFPDVTALRITLAFHLLCTQGRIAKVDKQKLQRLVKLALETLGELLILAHKARGENRSHTCVFLSARIASSAVSNGP